MNSKKTKTTVAVGMSGGVDSTVAAKMLLDQGYEVIGLTMKIWGKAPAKHRCEKNGCYGPDEIFDIEDARQTARQLGIKHYVVDLSKEYEEIVLNEFRRQYLNGRTPNPCVICNPRMKFGELWKKATELGLEFDHFATGHYAQIEYDAAYKLFLLKKGADPKKDQSYFLYSLNQDQLAKTLFPLGRLHKDEVRAIAKRLGLDAAEKQESQDFISDGDFSSLFSAESMQPGTILDEEGNKIGEHEGIANYTIGQRRGTKVAAGKRIYVTGIDAKANTVTMGPEDKLFGKTLVADHVNWIKRPGTNSFKATAKIRYKHAGAPCFATITGKSSVKAVFDEPQRAITCGQAIVFYDGDIVLGGGTIDEVMDSTSENESMAIRRATDSDKDGIKEILTEQDLTYPTQEIKNFWVATHDDKIVGVMQLIDHGDFTFLCSLGVAEKFQGKGIGKKLMKAVLDQTKKDVFLYTVIPSFFEKLGFERSAFLEKLPPRSIYRCDLCESKKCVCMVRPIL